MATFRFLLLLPCSEWLPVPLSEYRELELKKQLFRRGRHRVHGVDWLVVCQSLPGGPVCGHPCGSCGGVAGSVVVVDAPFSVNTNERNEWSSGKKKRFAPKARRDKPPKKMSVPF